MKMLAQRVHKLRSALKFVAFALMLACLDCQGQARTRLGRPADRAGGSAATAPIGPVPSSRAAAIGSGDWKSVASSKSPETGGAESPDVAIHAGGARAVRAAHGAVTSAEPNATRAGIRILEQGGTAVDAAVAVAYALAVTNPSAGNVGGGGFMLVRPAGGPTSAIDFRETAPMALTQAKFDAMIKKGARGPDAVGVPGTVAGLYWAHQRFGKLRFADLLAPAIELAEKGHPLGARQAASLARNWPELVLDPEARAVFGDRRRKPTPAGKLVRYPALAETLRRIAKDGNAGFYQGPTANALVAGVGNQITLEDLKTYRPRVREPLTFSYRGLSVQTMPPPSAGGAALAVLLKILEELGAYRLEQGSTDRLHLFIEASKRAQSQRRFEVGDPDWLDGGELSQKIARWTNPKALLASAPIDLKRGTPSAKVHPLYQLGLRELEHTTHFSVVDAQGMVVSCTVTLSAGFGAKMVVSGTGIVLNNSVAAFGTAGPNRPAPGHRSTSSMAPTLVLKNETPVLVLGSPGGDTIPSTVAQVLTNVIDRGMTIDQAVDAPRVHHGFVPDELRIESDPGLPARMVSELLARGHHLSKVRMPMGDANVILIQDKVAWAYADPREDGLALAAR